MNPGYSHSQTSASASGDTSRRPLHLVDFFCRAPQAQKVSLIGDFNGWHPEVHPMTRMPDGGWVIRMELPHGHHQYAFLVDGVPTLDPNAMGKVHNERNETVSLIAIS